MKKYRVKLTSGRVIGPFQEAQIIELFNKGLIQGEELAHVFPSGDWESIEQLIQLKKGVPGENLVNKISSIKSHKKEEEQKNFKEFSYKTDSSTEDINNKKKESEEDEKTIISPETLEYLAQKKKEAEKRREEKEQELLSEKAEEQKEKSLVENLNEDSTQMLNIGDLDKNKEKIESVIKELNEEEVELEKTQQEQSNNEKDENERRKVAGKEIKKNKKIIYIVVAIIIGVFILNSNEDKESKKRKLVYPKITFPTEYESRDPKKAKEYLIKGNETLKNIGYNNMLKAARYFNASLENQFQKNIAIDYLLNTYAKLLKHSNKLHKDSLVVYKLLKIVSPSILQNPITLMGKVLFHYNLKKYHASIRTVERFLKVESPSPELFAYYLLSLIKTGSFEKAKKVFIKLNSLEEKLPIIYISISSYLKVDNKFAEALNVILEAEKKYPNDVSLKIEKAELLVDIENFDALKETLEEVKNLNFEGSPFFYARYLEYSGLLSSYEGNYPRALKLFKKSLGMFPSENLRFRLSLLQTVSSSEGVNQLIMESKSQNFIKKAKKYLEEENLDLAFTNAINASDIYPNYIPAKIVLAEIQVKKGYLQRAINLLEGLNKKYPGNREVLLSLLDVYIESYKFSDANQILSSLTTTEAKNDYRVWVRYGELAARANKTVVSISHFQSAVNLNPVNDRGYYLLGRSLLDYKKFKESKAMIQKAIDLDPSIIDYRLLYGEILYETDGPDTAVGYLRDVLVDFPENSKALAAIGIYYFRSGQIKFFNQVKEKLITLHKKDISLYQFLVKASLMNERFDEVIKYGEELIKLEPGNLEVRMTMAKILIEKEEHTKALEVLKEVSERLDSYPKLKLFKSKLYLLVGEKEQAIKLGMEEIKSNPGLADAYVHLGDIYKNEEEFVLAEQQYKMARKISPNKIEALLGMAYIHFKRAQYEIALNLYKKAVKSAPESPAVYKQLGDVYRHLGQGGLAIDAYKTFLELDPKSKYKKQIETYIRMLE